MLLQLSQTTALPSSNVAAVLQISLAQWPGIVTETLLYKFQVCIAENRQWQQLSNSKSRCVHGLIHTCKIWIRVVINGGHPSFLAQDSYLHC